MDLGDVEPSGDPLALLRLELEHGVAAGTEPSPAQVREAALRVVSNAQPLHVALLLQSELLLPKEEERLKGLEASATLRNELRFQVTDNAGTLEARGVERASG